jgi:hypothetical protein
MSSRLSGVAGDWGGGGLGGCFVLRLGLVDLDLVECGGEGRAVASMSGPGGGTSWTLGRPWWGPRRFRTDEKCSQSW